MHQCWKYSEPMNKEKIWWENKVRRYGERTRWEDMVREQGEKIWWENKMRRYGERTRWEDMVREQDEKNDYDMYIVQWSVFI